MFGFENLHFGYNSLSEKKQEVSAILTKKRLSYDTGAEYLSEGVSFEEEMFRDKENTPSDDRRRYQKALYALLENNLTKKQKCYIILYYRDKLTVSEIAEKFGIDKSTVSRTITRGRQRIVGSAGRSAMSRLFFKK